MHLNSRSTTSQWRSIASLCLLGVAWLYANHSAIEWLWRSLLSAPRLHLILAGGMLLVVLVQVVRRTLPNPHAYRQLLSFSVLERRLYPLLLMLGAVIMAVALEWLVDIEQLTVLLFLLGTYGLCGLVMRPSLWRQGLPIAILIACVLPFSVQFGSGLGFPARVLTAHVVERLLASWQIAATSSHDIIILENGIAHVDLPCSGLKSLWTGTLFLLAATWLEGRQIGARWLLVCLANLFLLVSANIVRVLLLVLATQVLQQPIMANVLHLPLGLLGFIGACSLTWVLLQRVPKGGRQPTPLVPSAQPLTPFSQMVLVVVLIGLGLLSQLNQAQLVVPAIAPVQWPTEMASAQIPLSEAETHLFSSHTATVSEKRRFTLGSLSGSILIVGSTSWSTHHAPELCFVGNGLKVDQMERKRLAPDLVGRWLSLQDGKLSATYWFQSPHQTTDDFLSRIWSEITRRDRTWVMVSVLFDHAYEANNPQIQRFATAVHDAIDHSLNGA